MTPYNQNPEDEYVRHIHEEVLERSMELGLSYSTAASILNRPETVGSSVAEQWGFLESYVSQGGLVSGAEAPGYGRIPRRTTEQGRQPLMGPARWMQHSEAGRAQMRRAESVFPEPGKSFDPFSDPLEQWKPGYVSFAGSTKEQFPLKETLQATPWPVEGGTIHTGLREAEKFPKRIKQMTSRYEQVFASGKPIRRAPWRAGPTANMPERGQIMRTAVLFGPALPEGMSLIEQRLGPAANLKYVEEQLPKGFKPQLAQMGTSWGYKEPIELFGGHAGISPGDWERHRLLRSSVRGNTLRALLRRDIPLTRGLGLSTHWGKDYLVGADVSSFLGESGFDIVKSGGFRDVYGAAYSALGAMTPKKFQQVTGMERPQVWSEAAQKLVDAWTSSGEGLGLREFDIQRVMTRGQFNQFRQGGWDVKKQANLGGGRYNVRMRVPGMELDMFTMLTRAGSYEHRTPFVSEHTLGHFKRHAPQIYEQFMEESKGVRSSFTAMQRAYLASRGGGKLPRRATTVGGPEVASVLAKAERRALKETGAETFDEVPMATMMRSVLESVPEEWGALAFPGTKGRTQFFPNPRHIPRVTDTLRGQEQAGTFGFELASLLKARASGDEGVYQKQLARTALAQHRAVSSYEFRRKASGAVPRSLYSGAAAGSYANMPEEVYLPTRAAARASGIKPGSERYTQFAREFEEGKEIPLAAWREPTTMGEQTAQQRFVGKHIGQHPVEAFRDVGVPIFSAEAGMAMGGDFDKDDYYIARVTGVDLPTAKRMRQQLLQGAETHPAGELERQRGKLGEAPTMLEDVQARMQEQGTDIPLAQARQMFAERAQLEPQMGIGYNIMEEMHMAAPSAGARRAVEQLGGLMYQQGQDYTKWSGAVSGLAKIRNYGRGGLGSSPEAVMPSVANVALSLAESGTLTPAQSAALYAPEGMAGEAQKAIEARDVESLAGMMGRLPGGATEWAETSTLGRMAMGRISAKRVAAGEEGVSPELTRMGRALLSVSEMGRHGAATLKPYLKAARERRYLAGSPAALDPSLFPEKSPGAKKALAAAAATPGDMPRVEPERTAAVSPTFLEQARERVSSVVAQYGSVDELVSTSQARRAVGAEGSQEKELSPLRQNLNAWLSDMSPGARHQAQQAWQQAVAEKTGIRFRPYGAELAHDYRAYQRGERAQPGPQSGYVPPGAPPGGGPPADVGGTPFAQWDDDGEGDGGQGPAGGRPGITINFPRAHAGEIEAAYEKLSKYLPQYAEQIKPAIENQKELNKGMRQVTRKMMTWKGKIDDYINASREEQARIAQRLSPEAQAWIGRQTGADTGRPQPGWAMLGQAEGRALESWMQERMGQGTLGAVGQALKKIGVGWVPFQMRRAWRMAGAPVFEKYIPAAAEAESIGWQTAQAIGGYTPGLPQGVAGGVMRAKAGKQQAMINAGRLGYRAWGGLMGQGQGIVPTAAAIGGPAAGAGMVSLIGGLSLSSIPGLGITAGMATGAAGAVAGAGLLYGAGSALASYSAPTVENQIAAASGGGWGRTRAALARGLTTLPTDLGEFFDPTSFGRTSSPTMFEEADLQQSAGQRILTTLLGRLAGQERMGALNKAAQQLRRQGGIWSAYTEPDILKQLNAFAPYEPKLQQMTATTLGQQGPPEWVTRAVSRGMQPKQFQQLAGNLGMGAEGVQRIMMQAATLPAYQARQYQSALGQWGALSNFGVPGETIEQLVKPEIRQSLPNQVGAVPGGPPQVVGPGALQKMTGTELWQFNRLMKGNKRAWSQLALRGGTFPGTNYQMPATPSLVAQGPAGMQIGTIAPIGYGMSVGQFQQGYGQAAQRLAIARQTGDFVGPASLPNEGVAGAAQYQQMAWPEGSIWDIQDRMTAQQLSYSRAQAGMRMEGIRAQRQYYQQMWPLQDQATQLSYVQQMGGVSEYGGNQYTGAFQFQRQQAGMSLGFNLRGLALSREQAAYNQQYQRQQLQFQMETAGIQYGRRLTRRGWQREDWTYQQGRMAREFGWKMEDFDEAIRFATGRQRKRLITRQERATVRYGEQRSRFEEQKERQKEQWQWEDEDHERRMERLQERRQRQEKLAEFQEQRFDLQEQRLKAMHGLQMEQLDEREQAYQENYELQEEQRKLRREHQMEELDRQEKAAGAAAAHAEAMAGLQEEYRNVQREQKVLLSEWQHLMIEAIIEMIQTLGGDVGPLRGYLLQQEGIDYGGGIMK